jgi:hypothetical protein
MTKQTWTTGYTSYSAFTTQVQATPYTNPSNVQQINLSVGDRSLSVTWLPLTTNAQRGGAPGALSYDITLSTLDTLGVKTRVGAIINTTSTSASFVAPGYSLVNGTDYTVDVQAKILNSETSQYVLSGVETRTATVDVKPADPLSVDFIPGDGKITVQWYSPPNDATYTFVKYEIYVDNGFNSDSYLNVAVGTKNSVNITLDNGIARLVKIRRVASGANNVLYYSNFISTQSAIMPFGLPLITSAAVDSGDRRKINFTVRPNGSPVTQAVCLAVTDKYTAGDVPVKSETISITNTSGSINFSVPLVLAENTSITSFLSLVINAKGAAVYPTI